MVVNYDIIDMILIEYGVDWMFLYTLIILIISIFWGGLSKARFWKSDLLEFSVGYE